MLHNGLVAVIMASVPRFVTRSDVRGATKDIPDLAGKNSIELTGVHSTFHPCRSETFYLISAL
jgi:hypothetical protein